MKAKQFIVLISIWVAGIVLEPDVFAEEAETFEPDFDALTAITVSFGGWRGWFLPDGAASLERRAAHREFWDKPEAPEGSFSFEELYNLMISHQKPKPVLNPKECLSITFLFNPPDARGLPSFFSFYIEDTQVIRTLMHGLREKTVPINKEAKACLEEIYSQYPLVPGEEPSPFRYGSKRNISKWLYGGILAALCAGAVLWFIRKKE